MGNNPSSADPNHKVFYDESGNRWEIDTTTNPAGNTVEFSTVYKGDTDEKIDSGITEYKGNSDVVLKKSNDTLVVPQNPAVLNDTSDISVRTIRPSS